ncbi:MAG TPA: type IX secretion system outer membrane channel protein PorV [Bacteroidales bacterium]|nr:type IX secretion system outer membrane channel protein PorV [Bacteroidales bacterium]
MKKNGINLVVCLFLLIAATARSENQYNPIINSVPSLSISPDAAASGLGDLGAATEPDVNSQYWNPSKYAQIESAAGVSLSFTPWLSQLTSDINLSYVAGYYKLDDRQAISGSLRYFSLGEVILRQSFGDMGYSIQPYEMAVDLGYSRMLTEYLSMGVTMRYIKSDLMSSDDPPGSAFSADISSYWKKPVYFGREKGSVAFGANISNIGTKISYDGGNSSYFIPTNLRIGGSVRYPLDDYNVLNISMDINKLLVPTPKDTTEFTTNISSIAGIFNSFGDAPGGFKEEMQEIYGSIGVEYAYNNQFFVRGGYFYENQYKGNRKYFTFGAGFKMSMFRLDASYLVSQAQSNPLDGTLRFSLAFDLKGIQMLLGR